jgi:hypothetical protein
MQKNEPILSHLSNAECEVRNADVTVKRIGGFMDGWITDWMNCEMRLGRHGLASGGRAARRHPRDAGAARAPANARVWGLKVLFGQGINGNHFNAR